MNRIHRACACFLATLITGHSFTPAHAAEPPPTAAATADPYSVLLDAIGKGLNEEALFAQILAQVRTVLLDENPDISWLEQQVPGTLDRMLAEMAPALRTHSERVSSEYRTRMIELLSRTMTAPEATQAAEFYVSPLGRTLISKVQDSYSVTSMTADATADGGNGDISATSVERDRRRTLAGTFRALTPEQMAQLEQQLTGQTWPHKFNALGPQMIALQVRMENTPLLPESEAAMGAALTRVVDDAMASLEDVREVPGAEASEPATKHQAQ